MTDIADSPILTLSDALRDRGYATRAECDADVPFLLRLYASTRANELALLPWSQPQKEAFVQQQFSAQRQQYRLHFPDTGFAVITRDDAPVGRLYLQRRESEYHVIDITLLPEIQRQGVGTAVFETLFARARAERVGVGLSVAQFNPALALYLRLGFRPIGEAEVYLEMAWQPDAAPAAD